MFRELNSFFIEEGIIIINNKINVVNYKKIDYFDLDKIIISINNKKIIFKGNNLVLTKLLNNEVEIKGEIKLMEFR